MPRLSSSTETWHPTNSAVYTNDVDSFVVLVTPVRSGVFRHLAYDVLAYDADIISVSEID
jgi:hypothetical protein